MIDEKLETLAKEIFSECAKDGEPVSMWEALEMAEMEIESKKNGRHYETTEKKKTERKPKERKVDNEKKEILLVCLEALKNKLNLEIEMKTETELNFVYNENRYTLKLTKHRKK